MDKVYNPKIVEKKWYRYWEENGFFRGEINQSKKPFSMVIPPPNVTGNLHMGHALNNTLQDIVTRQKRMQGTPSLWLPGTDHAGIATQNVVERELAKENVTRHDLGREKFIQKVWEWKEQYGGMIINQLKALGCSCDWSRERFTLDEPYTKAVREVFVRLYEEGHIYRGDYIVNWCPRCHTALSDIEVEYKESAGNLWYIRYPIKDSAEQVVVATTRPETMLGDTAVAVNPQDTRYTELIGLTVVLPLINRGIPVVADDFVDPEFGTGAVKVTPAHDPNDFEIGNRHSLERVVVMTGEGAMNENAGSYKGLDRYEARQKIVEDLEKQGLLDHIEEHTHSVGRCYRCDTVIEPYLSKQWFISMKPLAGPAIKAVEEGKVKFTPASWTKVYFDWMHNIRDWCISRQIWWGHRIPAYYCSCGEMIVSMEKPDKCSKCSSSKIEQDPDVLDTWFSSALWPFATLGWPDETADLKYFYPTSLLTTSHDIIYFWVARMIIMGLHFAGEVPFADVYINPLIRDAQGRKMSKSRGNVIDPLDIIDKYGTDALRFTMASLAVPGRDVFLSEERVEGYRNFANKIWNASRFILAGLDSKLLESEAPKLEPADRWIISRLNKLILELEKYYDVYDFSRAAKAMYDFFWSEFADWYIELAKPRYYGEDLSSKTAVSQVLVEVLQKALKLLHPFMPFITEEIWQQLPGNDSSIMVASYPEVQKEQIDDNSEEQMALIMQVTTAIRGIRSELKINPGLKIRAIIKPSSKSVAEVVDAQSSYIKLLAKLEEFTIDEKAKRPPKSAVAVVSGAEIYLPLAELLDVEAETSRLNKKFGQIIQDLANSDKKLSNKAFVANAPAQVVEKEKEKNKLLSEKKDKLEEQIQILKG